MDAKSYTCALCDFTGPAFPEGRCTSAYLIEQGDDGRDRTLCRECAERRDRERVRMGAAHFFGYLGSHPGNVQAERPWGIDRHPGTTLEGVHGRTLGHVVHVGAEVPLTRQGCFGVRHYVRVRMFDGSLWHGTGAPGMYCRLRRFSGRDGRPFKD